MDEDEIVEIEMLTNRKVKSQIVISVMDSYSETLKEMLQKLNIDTDDIEVYLAVEEELSCMFSFALFHKCSIIHQTKIH